MKMAGSLLQPCGGVYRLARGLGCLLLLAWALTGCALLPKEEVEEAPTLAEPPPSRTVTYTVKRGSIAEEIRGLGRVAGTREADLYFTAGGRVKTLAVKTGDPIKQGELLAQLETGDLEYQLSVAQVDQQEQSQRLLQAERLAQINGITNDPLVRDLQYDLERIRLRLGNLKERIAAATIVAPFSGRVTSVRTQEGREIKEYETILTVVDPTQLEIQLEVSSQSDLGRIVPRQKARVQISRGQWVGAAVYQVPSPTEEKAPGVPERRVRLRLTDPSLKMNFDDLVETVIVVREKDDALLVPNAAVRQFFGRTFVRVLEADARREVDVQTGIQGATETEILVGLQEGQIVVGR